MYRALSHPCHCTENEVLTEEILTEEIFNGKPHLLCSVFISKRTVSVGTSLHSGA